MKSSIDTEVLLETRTAVRVSIIIMMGGALGLLAGLLAGFFDNSTSSITVQPVVPGSLSTIQEYSYHTAMPYVQNHLLVKMKSGNDINQVITDVLASPTQSAPTKELNNTTTTSSSFQVVRKKVLFTPKVQTDGTIAPTSAIPGSLYDIEFSGDGFNPVEYAAVFAKNSGVEYAEPDFYIRIMQTSPNDPYFSSTGSWNQSYRDLWGLEKIGFTPEGQNSAWDIEKGSASQVVAVIDTGVDYTHEDLANRIWMNAGEDTNGNGTIDGELFDDFGADGLADFDEEGWDPINNTDPHQDNYDAATNSGGTEGNRKYEVGEPFADCGLDGICKDDPRYFVADSDGTETNALYDAGDYNFVDNDNNGYVDDIRGWDFAGAGVHDWNVASEGLEFTGQDNNPVDTYGHGSHVAGTIAAIADDGKGLVGVNWNSRIMAVKAFYDWSGATTTSALIGAIRYAADNGATVANASWGAPTYSEALHESIRYAYQKGMVVVAAAGNNGLDVSRSSPASFPEVITVSAFNQENGPTYFTNFGGKIDVAAPGGGTGRTSNEVNNILSVLARNSVFASDPREAHLLVGKKHIRLAGTSMAAPHVAGTVSLLMSKNPTWTIEQVRQALRISAVDVYTSGWDVYAGYGMANARNALGVQGPIGTHITSPLPGSTYSDKDVPFSVYTTIKGDNIASYVLSIGTGETPTSWATLATGSQAMENKELYSSIKPNELAKGRYVLRLVAKSSSGQQFEDRVTFTKTLPFHAGWPLDTNDLFLSGGNPIIADVDGSADGKLEIVQQGADATYIFKQDGTFLPGWPKDTGGEIWEPAVADFLTERAGKELAITTHIGASYDLALFDAQGNPITHGWPKTIGSSLVPKIADINGDGKHEIISHSSSKVQAWNNDGSSASSFINLSSNFVSIGNFNAKPGLEFFGQDYTLYSFDRTPITLTGVPYCGFQAGAAADVNNDGLLETFGIGCNKLYAHHGDGSNLEGVWPVDVKNFVHVPYHAERHPAIGDINGDGSKEIVVATPDAVYAFDVFGKLLSGWPVYIANAEATPILADVDGDGENDVVFNTFLGAVHAINAEGREIDGWPLQTNEVLFNSPAVMDIDGNGKNEVVVASGYFFDKGRIFVYDTPGTSVAWPMRSFNERNTMGDGFLLPGRAELVGSFAQVAPFEENSAALLEPYTLKLSVSNNGVVTASNIAVQVYDGKKNNNGTKLGADIVIPNIDPGASIQLEHAITFDRLEQAGLRELYLYTDATNTIPETYEVNVSSRSVFVNNNELVVKDTLNGYSLDAIDFDGSYAIGGNSTTAGPIVLMNLDTKESTVLSQAGKAPKIDKHRVAWAEGANIVLYDIDVQKTSIAVSTTEDVSSLFDLSDRYVAYLGISGKSLRLFDITTGQESILLLSTRFTVAPVFWNGKVIMYSPEHFRSYTIETKLWQQIPGFKERTNQGNSLIIRDDTLMYDEVKYATVNNVFTAFHNYASIYLPTNEKTIHPMPFVTSPLAYSLFPIDAHTLYFGPNKYDFSNSLKIPASMRSGASLINGFSGIVKYDDTHFIVSALSPTAATYMVELVPKNHAPLITPIPDKTVTVGSTLAFTLKATDLENDVISYSSSNLPFGAILNQQTGAFSWKAALLPVKGEDSGYNLRLKATDAKGASSEIIVKIIITPAPTCFGAGTLISRPDGTMTPIELLRPGDLVLAYDEATGKMQSARITKTFTHTSDEYLLINGKTVVTANHPVLSEGKWVDVGSLKIWDTLTSALGAPIPVTSLEQVGTKTTVYNLEVSPFHTYIADGFVVHNKATNSAPQPVANPVD